MSYYVTRSSTEERDYILIKHSLPHTNTIVMGVKFRDSFAVVEKDSKIYYRLKKFPFIKNANEYPLTFLNKLPFITRAQDIKQIYGADVYAKYMAAVELESNQEEEQEIAAKYEARLEDSSKCVFTKDDGKLCLNPAIDEDKVPYCTFHILEDPRLKEMGFKIPLAMNKKDRKALRKRAETKLREYSRGLQNVEKDKELLSQKTEDTADAS